MTLVASSPSCVPLGDDAEIARLRARSDALHSALIARDAYAHTTAHDLRTPLNTLSGLLHLMQAKFGAELPDKALEYIDYMSGAVTQMDEMSTRFLDHARTVSGPLQPEDVDMRAAIDAAVDEMHAEVTAADANIEVSGPTWPMMADPDLLRLMLINLIRNALEHRAASRPLVVSLALQNTLGSMPTLRVTDTGVGFAPSESHAVFLPFRKRDDGANAGIGLATCHAICKRHVWAISAQSDGIKGATFTVMFPRSDIKI